MKKLVEERAIGALVKYAKAGPALGWKNGTRLWSERDKLFYNLAKWRECYDGPILLDLAELGGSHPDAGLRTKHRVGRRLWFAVCNAAYQKILEGAKHGEI